ncbi:alpha/beta hydrolase [Alishewanella sp. 16-MA]|uniref:Alpha/beta hydrolase n=1 Tax=Alishewanella maricola TaxID=2795740 RepID=A0ABS8C4A8_9ALTE|nr:alpha/beta hydrolase [Alishewanella maricola]MCB5227141.1 alpha/beta hydrolase [Alishewanella maricola]
MNAPQHTNQNATDSIAKKTQQNKPSFWTYFAIVITILGGAIAPQIKAIEQPQPRVSFTVEVVGQGKPVLIIPGLMSDRRVWQSTVSALQADFQLHLISLAGFAGTPSTLDGKFLPKVQQELLGYVTEQQLQQPAVIGHSLGAFLAFSLASSAPKQIGTVIAVDGLPYIAPIFSRNSATQVADMQAQALQLKAYYQQLSSAQLKAVATQGIAIQARSAEHQKLVLDMAAASDSQTVGQAMYELLTTDLRPQVTAITSQVYLLGASGALTPDQQVLAAALYQQQIESIANAKLLMNTDSRHFIMLDEPDWFIAQLRVALKE